MSDGVPGPEEATNGAEEFAVAEEVARTEALAQASGAQAPDAHAAEQAAHVAAIADHGPDASPGDDTEGLPHAADGHDAHDDHGPDAGHGGHGDGHGGPALGPIDWTAYGAGLVGVTLGLVVAAVLAVTTGYIVL
jgi:hypothetical protein